MTSVQSRPAYLYMYTSERLSGRGLSGSVRSLDYFDLVYVDLNYVDLVYVDLNYVDKDGLLSGSPSTYVPSCLKRPSSSTADRAATELGTR